MNIECQCCGLTVLVLLLFFYLRQRTVGLYTEKIFLRILGVSITCVSLDILSVIVITYRTAIPLFFLDLICKSYLTSLLCISFCSFAYVLTDLHSPREYSRIIRRFMLLPAAA